MQINKNDLLINDVREQNDFKTISFSGYKKTEVKKQIIACFAKSKIENACYWATELICAGHFMDLWDVIILYVGKYIHLGNPKLPIYIDMRFQVFRNIILQGLHYNELQLRNNETIRKLFTELCCVLCMSPTKPALEIKKLDKIEEFDIINISQKLVAPSTIFSEKIILKNDPKEVHIAINEFMYHVSNQDQKLNMNQACYWIMWLIDFDTICKKNKQSFCGETRTHIPVEFKYQKEVIWIIWDGLFSVASNELTKKIIKSLLNIFCVKFTPSCVKKRIHILYFAVSIITEVYRDNIPMIEDKTILFNTLRNTSVIYKQIKKSEQSPNTEYLFSGIQDPNKFQKSIEQFDLVTNIISDISFTPFTISNNLHS